MKINFDSEIKHLDGTTLKRNDDSLTLKLIAMESLLVLLEDDRGSGEEKYKLYQIAVKVNVGGEVDLAPEEIAALKTRIGKLYGPAIVGPAFVLLNG